MPAHIYCAVLGCESSNKNKQNRFFRFPKVSKKYGDIGKLWKEFTRRKNFKSFSWRFCQLHFAHDRFKPDPKKRLRLRKGTVPTIYYKNGERIEVPYNPEYQKYYGPEAEKLFEETEKSAVDHEKELINLRYKKLCDIKNLCRFCFTNSKDSKCIDVSALVSYSIDKDEMLRALGCDTRFNATFSDIICEPCFLKVMEFQHFRKKCSDRQSGMLAELEELDGKIYKVQKAKRKNDAIPWFKVEIGHEPEDFQNSLLFNSTGTDAAPVFNNTLQSTGDVEICQVTVKQEPSTVANDDLNDDFADDLSIDNDPGPAQFDSDSDSEEFALSTYITPLKVEKLEEGADASAVELPVDEEPPSKKSKASPAKKARTKSPKPEPEPKPKRENYKDRTFECFFCRKKFLGRSNLRKHPCEVKHRACEVPDCGKKFPNQGSYANHLIRIHGMPKICSHYCPGCKTYYQMNVFEYKEHTRSCELNKDAPEQTIKCEICATVCSNLEAYTAHKLFHATHNLVESVDENGVKTFKKPKVVQEKEKICDLCGKVLSDYKNLRKHKVNVHLVDFTGDMFYCDLCPTKKPTRRLIYNHMKSVHIINWHRCEQCGKDFKSKRLLARHILYMHERHRLTIRCHICPHKPGFNATIYLEQHMRKHHGENSARQIERYRCDFGFCEATYSNLKTLEQHKAKAHGFYNY